MQGRGGAQHRERTDDGPAQDDAHAGEEGDQKIHGTHSIRPLCGRKAASMAHGSLGPPRR